MGNFKKSVFFFYYVHSFSKHFFPGLILLPFNFQLNLKSFQIT